MARNYRLPPARTLRTKVSTEKIVEAVIAAAEAKQAVDLVMVDVRKNSAVTDYIVICSGESTPQIRAIEKAVDDELRKKNIKQFRWEGVTGSGWVILDLGSIVVHVMDESERKYYNLEGLWGKDAIIYHY